MKRLREALEEGMWKSFEGYEHSVITLAAVTYATIVGPFCKKHDLNFIAGNGTFVMWGGGDFNAVHQWSKDLEWEATEDAPEGWQDVLDACYAEVPGIDCLLGAIMPGKEDDATQDHGTEDPQDG